MADLISAFAPDQQSSPCAAGRRIARSAPESGNSPISIPGKTRYKGLMVRDRFPRARKIAFAAAALALSACAGSDFYFGSGSVKEAEKIVAEANWDTARRITVDIRQNEFRPAILRLYVGEPYILAFVNRDADTHRVSASEFFDTVAVRQVVENGEAKAANANIESIGLSPGETKEIHVVPTLDGAYKFEDNSASFLLLWPKSSVLGTVGTIIVSR
jgi:plastocyanin